MKHSTGFQTNIATINPHASALISLLLSITIAFAPGCGRKPHASKVDSTANLSDSEALGAKSNEASDRFLNSISGAGSNGGGPTIYGAKICSAKALNYESPIQELFRQYNRPEVSLNAPIHQEIIDQIFSEISSPANMIPGQVIEIELLVAYLESCETINELTYKKASALLKDVREEFKSDAKIANMSKFAGYLLVAPIIIGYFVFRAGKGFHRYLFRRHRKYKLSNKRRLFYGPTAAKIEKEFEKSSAGINNTFLSGLADRLLRFRNGFRIRSAVANLHAPQHLPGTEAIGRRSSATIMKMMARDSFNISIKTLQPLKNSKTLRFSADNMKAVSYSDFKNVLSNVLLKAKDYQKIKLENGTILFVSSAKRTYYAYHPPPPISLIKGLNFQNKAGFYKLTKGESLTGAQFGSIIRHIKASVAKPAESLFIGGVRIPSYVTPGILKTYRPEIEKMSARILGNKLSTALLAAGGGLGIHFAINLETKPVSYLGEDEDDYDLLTENPHRIFNDLNFLEGGR